MSRVYRHQYANGKFARKWYIEYRDAANVKRRRPAYRSKDLSISLLAETLEREERIRAGVRVDPIGLEQSLSELIEKWERSKLSKGFTVKHSHNSRADVEAVCRGCRFSHISELDAGRAQGWLESKVAAGWTNRTYGHHRSSLISFGRFVVERERLLHVNPFKSIEGLNPELNTKITRRVLSEPEFRKLLDVARNGPEREGVSGESRYWLYAIAGSTGLRLGALLGLAVEDFDLKAGSVTSRSSLQKNRKQHCVPLPQWLTVKLAKWLKGRSGLLWPDCGHLRKHGARMMRFDLERAGIAFVTSEGRTDFHSLRHLFAVRLVKSGASVVETQTLLDHCSPALTSRYYRHLRTDELRGPVGKLPKL